MAKAKTTAQKAPAKKSSSKRKAKEPIVEIEAMEPTEDVTFNAPEGLTEPEPNVIWRKDKEPPPSPLKIGADLIELPDAETQRAGFYHAHARRLVRQFGYKFFNPLS
jgi:hypothetical protein